MEMQQQLKEAQDALVKVQQELAESRQASQRLQEALIIKEAGELVASKLAASTLPHVAHARLKEALTAKATIKDGKLDVGALETVISEAIKAEAEYIASIAGSGAIKGLGGGAAQPTTDEAATIKRMSEGFAALGLGKKEAEIAANGRVW